MPVRLELGPRDLAGNEARCVLRYNGEKSQMSLENIGENMKKVLDDVHDGLFARCKQERDANLSVITTFDEMVPLLNKGHLLLAPWCETPSCEDAVKKESATKSLFYPF